MKVFLLLVSPNYHPVEKKMKMVLWHRIKNPLETTQPCKSLLANHQVCFWILGSNFCGGIYNLAFWSLNLRQIIDNGTTDQLTVSISLNNTLWFFMCRGSITFPIFNQMSAKLPSNGRGRLRNSSLATLHLKWKLYRIHSSKIP